MTQRVPCGCTEGLVNDGVEGPLKSLYSSEPLVQVCIGPGGSCGAGPLLPTPRKFWWPIAMNILWRPVPGYTRLDHEGVPRMSGNLCTAWLWRPGRCSPFGGAKGYCPCLCPTVLLKNLNQGPMSERGHALVLAWVLQVWGTIVGCSMFCSWGRPPHKRQLAPRSGAAES